MNFLRNILRRFGSYWRQSCGAIAIAFAVAAPVVVGAAGMAIDYSNAYLVKQRLIQAVDAAALAGAASSTDPTEIKQKVKDFFEINYPEEKLGFTFDPVVTVTGNLVQVSGSASYNTFFLDVIGVDDIEVHADTVVQREVKGLEVVLVLDNTGSMGSNNNIAKLRTASCEFVEILYGTYDSEAEGDCLDRYGSYVTAQNEYVKVGLVPYATSVNVGPYGVGYDNDGVVYDASFLNNPLGLSFSNDSDTDICVLEDDDGSDVLDQEGPWYMYRWCRDKDDGEGKCDYYNNYVCTSFNSSGTSCQNWQYQYGAKGVYRAPNYLCPRASILPLTEDMTALKDRINEMEANGNTYGNLGMVWGWRVLSPDYPFTEGVDWNDQGWRKVIVMMTDGNNVLGSPYGGYGYRYDHSLNSNGDLNDRLKEVCENMDVQDDVTVYTITFDTGGISDSTEQLYKDCAINGGRYEHVTTTDDLIDVFKGIATELSNLHIKS